MIQFCLRDNSVVPRMELTMRSIGISSARNLDSVVLDPDQKDFSGDTNGLQRTASNRLNSNTNPNGVNETRGNITFEGRDLPVGKKNLDRETPTHHRVNLTVDSEPKFCVGSENDKMILSKRKRRNKYFINREN